MENPINDSYIPEALRCQTCGRADESLRLASYPALLSLVAFTWNYEFRGRWCRRHRTLHLLLAVFITTTIGWIGLPISIAAVPLALLRLARDRSTDKDHNAHMLVSLAEAKEQAGDLAGAERCLEHRFQYGDGEWSRAELPKLAGQSEKVLRAGRVLSLLLLALALGAGVGMADFFWNRALSSLGWFIQPLFGWVALSAFGFPAVFLLRELLLARLERSRARQDALALLMALATGSVSLYGILTGRALANFVGVSFNSAGETLAERLPGLGAVLARGALLEWNRFLTHLSNLDSTQPFAFLMVAFFCFLVLLLAAWRYNRWQRVLSEIVPPAPARFNPSALVAVGVPLALAVLMFGVPQRSIVDVLESRDYYEQGFQLAFGGQYERAVPEFKLAQALDPHFSPASEALAWSYYQLGDTRSAVAELGRAILARPREAGPHYTLGKIYYFEDLNKKSIEEFQRAVELDPRDAQAYLGLGWAIHYTGDYKTALANFQKAAKLDPYLYDAYIGQGAVYDELGDESASVKAYETARKINIEAPEAYGYLGTAYYHKHEYDKAIDPLENAVMYDKDNRYYRAYLILSYIQTGRLDRAIELSRQSIILIPDWSAPQALLASALLDQNKAKEANLTLDAAMTVADESNFDRLLLINALFKTGRYTDAEQVAREALEQAPNDPVFLLDLAEAQSGQGKYDEALRSCDLAESAGSDPAQLALQRGTIYYDVGKYRDSVAQLKKAVELAPDQSTAFSLLSSAYYELSQYQQSLEAAREAARLAPADPEAYVNLAFAELALKDVQEAIKAAAQASSLSPEYDLPHFLLGMSYLEIGQKGLASQELSRFLETARPLPGRDELKKQAVEALNKLQTIY